MSGRLCAVLMALAFLCGFSAAPFTHAHQEIDWVTDAHHPHGEALVHTHASPHARHDTDHSAPEPESHDGDGERIWSVESFVFQPPAPHDTPTPVLCVFGEPHAQLTCAGLGIPPPQPTAHGPPLKSPSGLRAPPAFLPLLV